MRAFRDAWRTLTSMRTALVLLFLLALAAVPGSLLPQVTVDPNGVQRWYEAHARVAPLVDALGGFDVYASPIFFALYVALAVSLVGCLWPRIRVHVRALRSRPPAAPRRLSRLPAYAAADLGDAAASEAVDTAERSLRRGRWRVERRVEESGEVTVAAEKGYARETGNLVFHVSLLLLLASVAIGWLQRFEGRMLLVEGGTFTSSQLAYDVPPKVGRLVAEDELPAFSLRLEDFAATYLDNGQPSSFEATVRYGDGVLAEPTRRGRVRVNHPLGVGGARIYLLDHGYAPILTLRDGAGRVLSDGPTPAFGPPGVVPRAVIKVADVSSGPQLAVEAFFFPTVDITADGRLRSRGPAADAPAVQFAVYAGDLGLDTGVPQPVTELDTDELVLTNRGVLLPGGEVAGLPGGATLRFDGWREWATFQAARDPGKPFVLASSIGVLVGLALSLRTRRRRVWLRATPQTGSTLVELGGLSRGSADVFRDEFDRLARRLELTPEAELPESELPESEPPESEPPGPEE